MLVLTTLRLVPFSCYCHLSNEVQSVFLNLLYTYCSYMSNNNNTTFI